MWTVSAQKLRAARQAKRWTVEALAARAGVSDRTIRKLEAADSRVRPDTLDCLAKALGVDAMHLLTTDDTKARTALAGPRLAPSPRGARTRLEALRERERANAPAPRKHGAPALLTADDLERLYTAFLVHEGAQFSLRGRVEQRTAATRAETAALGAVWGTAARFRFEHILASGDPVVLTPYTRTKETTLALLDAVDGREVSARVIVVVAAEGAEPFTSYLSGTPRGWGLVVDAVE
jgi:transcriptional regulator with XRE-family HTH domain